MIDRLFRPARPRSPLKAERADLVRKIAQVKDWQSRVSAEFFANGGVCCPGCGVPGYLDSQMANERRMLRLRQIDAKLTKDSQ
jgi:hypothetical protein